MKFIVAPVKTAQRGGPPMITQCALCSENANFCNYD